MTFEVKLLIMKNLCLFNVSINTKFGKIRFHTKIISYKLHESDISWQSMAFEVIHHHIQVFLILAFMWIFGKIRSVAKKIFQKG